MSMEMVPEVFAAEASREERVAFIRRTYAHLLGAVVAFVGIEAFLFSSGIAARFMEAIPRGRFGWLIVLGAFMLVGWIAEKWARDVSSLQTQYAGLVLYVIAEAFIFVPLLWYSANLAGNANIIPMAGVFTGLIFTGLTGTVFFTRHDFSWMRPALAIAGMAALGIIVTSILFGFSLGTLFCAAMVVVASGYILYYTSEVLHRYPTHAHVAASLALFAAVALLFWYILRILGSRR